MCEVVVKCDKHFFVDSHRKSAKHASKVPCGSTSITKQTFISPSTNMAEDVAKAFLAADIPLHKLEHPALRTLFHQFDFCPQKSYRVILSSSICADIGEVGKGKA